MNPDTTMQEPLAKVKPETPVKPSSASLSSFVVSSPAVEHKIKHKHNPDLDSVPSTLAKAESRTLSERPAPVYDLPADSQGMKRSARVVSNPSALNGELTTSKRSKPAPKEEKMVPNDYAKCEVDDMVILIASMMSALIETNDRLPVGPEDLTRFHSRY